jgi:hypothetical protein
MTNLSRRTMLLGASSALAALTIPGVARAAPVMSHHAGCLGCAQASARFQTDGDMIAPSDRPITILMTSGDLELDRFLGIAVRRLAQTFRVCPGFAFFDDGERPNAFATERSMLPDGRGTVLMGRRLFYKYMRDANDGGVTVIAISAHEFGHIYQIDSGCQQSLARLDNTVRPIELHADFLAGYFLALRNNDYPELDLHAVGDAFIYLGDNNVTDRSHHGTPAERYAALDAGYRFGRNSNADIDAASEAGFAVVKRII